MIWEELFNLTNSKEQQTSRSTFDRDFDRIIFSHPFRKLQDKTQVHPLPEHDFVHNRLTHSLEVSSVGRSLGRQAGDLIIKRNPNLGSQISVSEIGVIVASASLAHDIGNPAFGHSGEEAISEYFNRNNDLLENQFSEQEWSDLINFEGNAQGFRLLNKSGYQGLKLSYPTLAAFTKYPRPSKVVDKFKPRRSQKKYGFYSSEQPSFNTMVQELKLMSLSENQWVRHPLAFLVEAADDICYHIIDLEDGCNLGLVSHEDTVELYAQILGEQFDPGKLKNIKSKREQISTLRALTIGKLIHQCIELFGDVESEMLSGKFDHSLADVIPLKDGLEDIKMVSIEKIYRSRSVLEIEAAGYHVINGLLDSFVPAAINKREGSLSKKDQVNYRLLPEDVQYELEHSDTLYIGIRSLLDYISGLTDTNAMNLYRKIRGISLPGR